MKIEPGAGQTVTHISVRLEEGTSGATEPGGTGTGKLHLTLEGSVSGEVLPSGS